MSKFGIIRTVRSAGFVYRKVTKLQNKQMQIMLFSLDSHNSSKLYIFKNFELGLVHDCSDWNSLVALLPQKDLRGAPSWLPPKGLFGMMFLKHYTWLSYQKLLDRFNSDWTMQLLCDILFPNSESMKDNSSG